MPLDTETRDWLEAQYLEPEGPTSVHLRICRRQYGVEVEVSGDSVRSVAAAYAVMCDTVEAAGGYSPPRKGSQEDHSYTEKAKRRNYAIINKQRRRRLRRNND